jgi:hypothetical protein
MTDPTAPGPWDEALRQAGDLDAESIEQPTPEAASADLPAPAEPTRSSSAPGRQPAVLATAEQQPEGQAAAEATSATRGPAEAQAAGAVPRPTARRTERSERPRLAGGRSTAVQPEDRAAGQRRPQAWPEQRSRAPRARRAGELGSTWQRRLTMTAAAETVRIALLAERMTDLIQPVAPTPESLAPERSRWLDGPVWS